MINENRSEPTEMTSDIEAAFEEVEENAPETEVVEELVEEPISAGEGEDTAPEVSEAEDSDGEPDSPAVEEEPGEGEVEAAEDKGSVEAVDEPPAGLSPAAREEWKDTPPAMKEAIALREKQFAQGIFQSQNDAKRAQQMDRSMAPHAQLFALTGNNPPEMVSNLLTTASVLQMGTPAQKAQVAAKIIQDFGVDIATLDGVLSGQGVPRETSQPAQSFDQQYDERRGRERQQEQQNYQNQQMQAVSGDVNAFANDPSNEFYKDVREDMADILDMAGKRGVNMDLPTAYQRACLIRPDIKSIIDGRTSGKNVANARGAAISLTGSPGGAGSGSVKDESLADTIRRAMGSDGNRI
jgi:hypothetical protein